MDTKRCEIASISSFIQKLLNILNCVQRGNLKFIINTSSVLKLGKYYLHLNRSDFS